ncbi:HET-domain-containing protein [Canariomyces notabilis]|uniref:HET-domain-containing protein n=1 Tax=Canariomyces notabilis TaxID=2074819 RepID=A0AAN6TJ23_9PEZI|nr:HET-domain-containing protein [Canariomyces arenarius]
MVAGEHESLEDPPQPRLGPSPERVSVPSGSLEAKDVPSLVSEMRKELWSNAYSRLVEEAPDLVDAFERILSAQLRGLELSSASLASQTNDIDRDDPEERLSQFRHIAERGLLGLRTRSLADHGIKEANKARWLVSEIIDKALAAARELATPWVGIYLGLEALLDSGLVDGVKRPGLAHDISKTEFYWNLPVLFLNEYWTRPLTRENRRVQQNKVIESCVTILSSQMMTICSYTKSRQPDVDFLRNLPQICNWKHVSVDFRGHIQDLLEHHWWSITNRLGKNYIQGLTNKAMSKEIMLRQLHSEKFSFVCAACGNLDSDNWGDKFYTTCIVDVQNGSYDCPACEVLIKGTTHFVKPLDETAKLTLYAHKDGSLKVEYHWGSLNTEDARRFEFFTEEGLPKPWPVIGYSRMMKSITLSRSAQLVSRWFRHCLAEHRLCKRPRQNLPTRVLYVGSEHREPRLVEIHNEEAQYTALSHCWGGMQHIHLTTTRQTLEDRRESIPLTTLPRTFRDAVLLTRMIGIEYIWIDSLCIIQDDDEDWARESARMAEVYQNAALTISADGAANDSEGLFEPSRKRSVEESRIQASHPADSAPVYVRKTTLRPFGDYVHVITHRSDQPLRRRGWTLQEWLLSARVVHFYNGRDPLGMQRPPTLRVPSYLSIANHMGRPAYSVSSKGRLLP